MAKVSLRIYNREIESLVDSGQLDEAIAHCRHILNVYPKHLETYRMIGKAYLEAKRYNEATDIFERILMAVPDDFVAHVGMSIIQDEQKNMDDAIWYMQRAFEVQPSNSAIQAELQRLYGRRDGVEPPKIRLTRGALAHMYVQGELYPQAISEISAVLEEDSERQDMQVLLARAYFHAGQQSEAAEMCSQLLRRYPYCFDANRILVELLPQTERGENVQVYRNRVNELNPYADYVTGSVFHTEEVSDAAVSLERLEWDGQPVDVQPGWRESLGIGREESASNNVEPDWLKTDLSSGSFAASDSAEEPALAPGSLPVPSADGDDQIPDFLRDAGWSEDSGTFQEGASFLDDADDSIEEPELAAGDLPDWVKAMAPTGADIEDAAPQPEPVDDLTQDDVPDWLQGLGDAQSTPAEEQPLAAEGDIPDWLKAMKPTDDADTLAQEQPQEPMMSEPVSSDDGDIPDWLKSMQPEEEQPAPQEIPQEPVPEPLQEAMPEAPKLSEESLSDWQIGEETPAGPVDFDKIDTGLLGTSAEEQDDAVAWLESLASKHGAKPEELVTDPEARKETAPEWVQKVQSLQEQGQAEEPAQPVDEVAMPAAPVSADDLGTSAEEQDDAVAWLESLASKHGAKPEELVTDPTARSETAPDWVQKAAEAGSEHAIGERPTAPPAEEPVDDEPDWMKEAKEVGESLFDELEEAQTKEPLPSADADETGMWLRDLGEEGGFATDEAEQPAAEGDIPDWLSGLDPEEAQLEAAAEAEVVSDMESAAEAEAAPGFAEEAELEPPDWLQSMETEVSGTEAVSTLKEDAALPDWLSGMEADSSEPEGVSAPSMEEGVISEHAGEAPELEITDSADEGGITDWLQKVESESSEAEVGEPAPEAADDNLPSWLAGLDDDAEQAQTEAGSDDDVPEWLRAETESEPVQAEPSTSTDWKPVEAAEPPEPELTVSAPEPEPKAEIPPVQAASTPPATKLEPEPTPEHPAPQVQEPYREPVNRSRTGMTGMLSAAQDPGLTEAQNELTRGNIPGAIERYSKLIKKGKLLEEIIFDLREALYRYPVEVAILQALGDAYMRASRLQEALDSYTKAEELLR
jgi:tetratricopeptide (TPR) repeat protein